MAVVIRSTLDDVGTTAGFTNMGNAAKKFREQVDQLQNSTKASSKTSAEGLGFITGALGQLHPSLALVGEQTVKQLPTIAAWGQSLAKVAMTGGTLGVIAGSVASIAAQMTKVRQETIAAEGTLQTLIDLQEKYNRVAGVGALLKGMMDYLEIDKQQLEVERMQIEATGKLRLNQGLMISADKVRVEVQKEINSGIAAEVVASQETWNQTIKQIEREEKRIDGLMQMRGLHASLTQEEADYHKAVMLGLNARLEVQGSLIEQLNDFQRLAADEESKSWIKDLGKDGSLAQGIKDADEAMANFARRIRELNKAGELTEQENARLMGAITQLQAKKVELKDAELERQKELNRLLEHERMVKISTIELDKQKGKRLADLLQAQGGQNAAAGGGPAAPQGGFGGGGGQRFGGGGFIGAQQGYVGQSNQFRFAGGQLGGPGQPARGGGGGEGPGGVAGILGELDRGMDKEDIKRKAEIEVRKNFKLKIQGFDEALAETIAEINADVKGGRMSAKEGAEQVAQARRDRRRGVQGAQADLGKEGQAAVVRETARARDAVLGAMEAGGNLDGEQVEAIRELAKGAAAALNKADRAAAEVKAIMERFRQVANPRAQAQRGLNN